MAKVEQYLCDACGEVLYGRKGMVFIKKRYVQFKGKLLMQDTDDPTTGCARFCYITKNIEEPELSFCDPEKFSCLVDYIKRQEEFWAKKREDGLRYEAEREHSGPSFVVGHKKY